jgi:hypothetical protein
MAEIKFEGAGATNKERRLARPPRCEAGRLTKILRTEAIVWQK